MTTPTYYGRPVIKEPVWIWSVPAYFFAGGIAGACAVLASAADVAGLGRLARRARAVAAVGTSIGSVLLVIDLGRPGRFLNMIRVLRPTSPMSIGSWVLASAGGANAMALLPGPAGRVAGMASGALGLPMAGYTATLLTTTAVPVWSSTRRTLPYLFVASSASAAAGALELFDGSEAERRVLRRFGMLGSAAEVVAAALVERDAGQVDVVAKPLRSGFSGALWKAAKVLTLTSLVLSKTRLRRAGAIAALAGSLTLRFALFYAGKASARDPHATFQSHGEL